MRLKSSLTLAAFALGSALAAFAQPPQTFTGTVSDSMCGAHHMMPNASAATCTRACIKEGSDFVLVVGDKLYTLTGDKARLDKFAGQTATVKGTVTGTTIAVASIAPAK